MFYPLRRILVFLLIFDLMSALLIKKVTREVKMKL